MARVASPMLQPRRSRKARAQPARLRPLPGRRTEASLPELDRLIHERLRLGIVSALAAQDVLAFTELKRLLDTTDGNLAVHARRLEDAGYISCVKAFDKRVPRTEYRLTSTGRRALERYLNHMEAIIRAVRGRP